MAFTILSVVNRHSSIHTNPDNHTIYVVITAQVLDRGDTPGKKPLVHPTRPSAALESDDVTEKPAPKVNQE